jgi:LysR family glycine cleavage system transcriptional activator
MSSLVFLIIEFVMRPSLSSTKVFVVVASIGSFTQAAQLLHVTQGAVSQQIAKLEGLLGVKLFDRDPKQLSLTPHGRRLYRGVSDSLERIEAELDAVVSYKNDEVVSITTFASFAAQWLLPRLSSFESQYPDLRLQLNTTSSLVNFVDEGIELGVRFGQGDWDGLLSEHILTHRIYPVAHADYAKKLDVLGAPGQLAQLPLFYDLESPTEWARWFAKVGLPGTQLKLMKGFSDTLVMLSALRNGMEGVALIGDHLTRSEIRAGSLVRVFEDFIEPEGSYYLVYPKHLPLSAGATAFREWVLQAA